MKPIAPINTPNHADAITTQTNTLRIAYTPDSDDAFNFYALEHGKVRLGVEGWRLAFERDHIIQLNLAARRGELDVVAVSSAAYPALADHYWVLSVGNSIGRGYGPVLVSDRYDQIDQLVGKRVAVAGIATTGGALAMMYCPGANYIEHPYDQIADGIIAGDFDAGVMIHEELLFFPEKGLRKVLDLGVAWCDDTGLPLPVGLNLVHKRLGRRLAHEVDRACRASLVYGHEHFDEAFAFASCFGRGCAGDHVAMFSNGDTVRLPEDVRRAMRIMFGRVASLGIGPALAEFEVIDG